MPENKELFPDIKQSKKYKPELGEFIGEGTEKKVYHDPNHPDQIIGMYHEFRSKESSRYVRARYYLTKILHMLFPDRIPDITLSTTEPPIIRREKLNLDTLRSAYKDGSREEILESYKNVSSYSLVFEIKQLGVFIDSTPSNFFLKDNDEQVYSDDFYPWFVPTSKFKRNFNPEKLILAIEEKLTGNDKEKAMRYLRRLEKLAAEVERSCNPRHD